MNPKRIRNYTALTIITGALSAGGIHAQETAAAAPKPPGKNNDLRLIAGTAYKF